MTFRISTVQRSKIITCVVVLIVGLRAANAQFSMKKKDPPPAPPPANVTVKVQIPSLAPMAESNASQVKGGLRITMEPTEFHAEESVIDSAREIAPPTKFGMVLKPAPNAIYVQHTQTPQLLVKPDRAIFHVHVNNDLPRVFRGSGIVVQFNVAGKVINVDPSGYGDLVNVIIPPRSEQEIVIVGPKVEDIPSPCTVGIFFYDVVTKMDDAGNVTEKQDYEWYYSYRTQDTEQEIPGPSSTASWVMPR
jgi:hypothetical protein